MKSKIKMDPDVASHAAVKGRRDDVEKGIEEFLSHLQVERRVSAHTLDAYRRDLQALSDWSVAQGVADVEAIGTEQLRAFITPNTAVACLRKACSAVFLPAVAISAGC